MIRLRNLVKKFGDLSAVNGVSIDVQPGEIFGFLGPNGAGKTTTVKIMSGLMRPTSGSVSLFGADIVENPVQAKRLLALIPDEPFVYPKLTGAEFMRFIGDLYEVPEEKQQKRIPELLEMFELLGWQGELLESYSHGMRQKLVIAGALLREPKAVLLDEPMVGLDPKSARMVRGILLDLAKSGVAIFMCTHILEIAEKLCGRIGIMHGGRLLETGTLDELRAKAGQSAATGNYSLEDVFMELTSEKNIQQQT
ncbi:MAG: ABC transporter ATP-binding protein [Elusimicrobiales bacterium]